MTMSTNPDGSTKWMFVQLTDFNGFAVIDFATHEEIKRIRIRLCRRARRKFPKAPIHRTAWRSLRTASCCSSTAG